MYQSYERRLPILPFSLEKVRINVIQFILCNISFLVIGFLGIVITVIYSDTPILKFLEVLRDFNTNCYITAQGAFSVMIIVGSFGILTHMMGYPPRMLCSLSCLVFCPFGLIIVGIGEASAISVRNGESLNRTLLLETHYYNHHDILFNLSQDKALVTRVQEQFSCCGVLSTKDWYLSDCNCMPISCCQSSKLADCKKSIVAGDKYKKLGFSPSTFSTFQALIWDVKCADKIQGAIAGLKRKWIILSAIYIIIYSIFATWHFHVTVTFKDLLVSKGGYVQLQIFKARWPSNKIKVRREYQAFARTTDVYSSTETESDPEEVEAFHILQNEMREEADFEEAPLDVNRSSINLDNDKDEFFVTVKTEEEDNNTFLNIFNQDQIKDKN